MQYAKISHYTIVLAHWKDYIPYNEKEGKSTYAFFLDVKKADHTVWRDGLWYKMYKIGVKGMMWRVVRSLYVNNRSCIFGR